MVSGELTKVILEGFEDADGQACIGTFTLQINPSSINLSCGLQYSDDEGVDNPLPQINFSKSEAQKISFNFVLDATGAYNGMPYDIVQKLEDLKKIIYYYKGDQHGPPFVRIRWNDIEFLRFDNVTFAGRLTSMVVDYTLFAPDGTPLRAKVSLSFKSTVSPPTAEKSTGKSSPDLTHLVTVKAGDNLPQMCKKIYGDAKYYTQVAAINNLANFRFLKPGIELIFPPLN